MIKLYNDWETASELDLTKVGAFNYLNHESTRPICFSFKIGDYRHTFKFDDFQSNYINDATRGRLWSACHNLDVVFVAHNAAFDKRTWDKFMTRYGFPVIPWSRWRCTVAKAYTYGLPGSLKDAGRVLELKNQKDLEGQQNMLFLSRPNKQGKFWTPQEKPDDFQKLYDYCEKDIAAMGELDTVLMDIPDKEQEIWVLDQEINDRGVRFDLPLVDKVLRFIETEKGDLKAQFNRIAGFNPTQREVFKEWMLTTYGVKLETTDKAAIEKIYSGLPPAAKYAVDLFSASNKSSLAKYPSIRTRTDDRGILRDFCQYHAAHTGRFGGRGVQLQNLTRPIMDLDTIIHCLERLDYRSYCSLYGNLTDSLSQAIRGMIIAR